MASEHHDLSRRAFRWHERHDHDGGAAQQGVGFGDGISRMISTLGARMRELLGASVTMMMVAGISARLGAGWAHRGGSSDGNDGAVVCFHEFGVRNG